MKKLLGTTLALLLVSCTGISDSQLIGELTLNSKYGYNSISFFDAKTKNSFSLVPGKYRIDFEYGFYGVRSPRAVIMDLKGNVIGRLEIPRKSFNTDGTFELYHTELVNTNPFNILGGRRRKVLSRKFEALNRQSCIYYVTVSCEKEDSEGKKYTTTCTESRWGNRDELWINESVQYFFRILFDAQDFYNVGQFEANSRITTERSMLAADECE